MAALLYTASTAVCTPNSLSQEVGDPNAQVDLTQGALDAYSPQQASSYAAGHDAGPNG